MEIINRCSFDEHKEIDAISYCPECRIYMCNKCEKTHSSFIKSHHPYQLKSDEDIFTGFCQEKNHTNKLQYFCKTHNQLCCSACISKLNKKGDGQHKDCDLCYLEDIKEEKKKKLIENIKCLEDLEKKFNEIMNNFKEIFIKIEKDKEELKLEVQKIFTQIRNAINEREDELLLKIDNLFNIKYINSDLIHQSEKLPKKIKQSLEKGKSINKEWDSNNLNTCINYCINIENNIKTINEINQDIAKYKSNEKIKIKFYPKEKLFNEFLETIKTFGVIYYNKYSFRECPNTDKTGNKIYTLTGENKNILTKTSYSSLATTICEEELNKSIEEHKWKIKILKSSSRDIYVGVAPIDFKINQSNYNTCGWYYYFSDSGIYSGPPHNMSKNMGFNKMNNEVIIIMNMKKRTLKFIVNNEDKGDAYTDIPIDKPLFPAVILANIDDSVEISEC